VEPQQEQLVTDNLALVRWIARRYAFGGRDLDDLVQEGTLGLIKAARSFDPSLGFAFSSFAYSCIQNHLRTFLGRERETLSLDEPLGDADGDTHADILPDARPSPEHVAVSTGHVGAVLASLPEREATVLRLRFGLDDGVERTGEEVGQTLGLSKMRVSQIERKALARIRKAVRKKKDPA
jgi:RNA polymerase sporulation-specific sigma factor